MAHMKKFINLFSDIYGSVYTNPIGTDKDIFEIQAIALLERLNARDAYMVCLRYGFTGHGFLTAKEIGKKVGHIKFPNKPLAPSVVGYMIKRSLWKLKFDMYYKKKLKRFLITSEK